MKSRVMLVLSAVALLLLSACGNDLQATDESSTTTESSDTTDAADSTDTTEDGTDESSSTTGDSPVDSDFAEVLADVEMVDDYCEAIVLLHEATEDFNIGNANPTAADVEEYFAFTDTALYLVEDLVPPELEDDYQTFLSAWPEYNAAAEDAGFDPVALSDPEILAIITEGEVGEANEAVDQYNDEVCLGEA